MSQLEHVLFCIGGLQGCLKLTRFHQFNPLCLLGPILEILNFALCTSEVSIEAGLIEAIPEKAESSAA